MSRNKTETKLKNIPSYKRLTLLVRICNISVINYTHDEEELILRRFYKIQDIFMHLKYCFLNI